MSTNKILLWNLIIKEKEKKRKFRPQDQLITRRVFDLWATTRYFPMMLNLVQWRSNDDVTMVGAVITNWLHGYLRVS